MKTIAKPKKIDFKKGKEENRGTITVEPCYPGYGVTLGNALRRVLLSSIPGAAVVGVKIKGADHEFMPLTHVKEDVLEIILNLKQLRAKVHTNEVVKLELDIAGEKEVKAGDISKNSDVEIVNKDLTIANITDMAGNLKMEILITNGTGYETIENRIKDEKKEIGYIEVDSIFSSILQVGLKVEDVRVGKMTNWEKLNLDITTDGTITPEEAFDQSTNILIDQFGALTEAKNTKEEKETEEKEEVKKEEVKEEKDEKDDTKKKK